MIKDSTTVVLFKINSLGITPSQLKAMPFGRRIEYYSKIKEWQKTAKLNHISQKRTKYKKAINEFIKLNDVKEYYCAFSAGDDYFDDSFEFYWK